MTNTSYHNKTLKELTTEEAELFAKELVANIKSSLGSLDFLGKEFKNPFKIIFEKILSTVNYAFAMFQESTKQLRIPIGTLADKGWFISSNTSIPDIIELAKLIKSDKSIEVDKWMIDFFKKELNEIENQVVKNFPRRSIILRSAFTAHRKAEYELSIPVMLTQAGGMCIELTGIDLYSKKKGVPKTSKFADSFNSDVFISSILQPLRQCNQIITDTHDLIDTSGILNRHGILHGIIIDYACETNAYKCVSLLNYLSNLVDYEIKGEIT